MSQEEPIIGQKQNSDLAQTINFQDIYNKCGEIVEDKSTNFSCEECDVVKETFPRNIVDESIERAVRQFKLPYTLQPFQSETLVGHRSVMPPGSGDFLKIILGLYDYLCVLAGNQLWLYQSGSLP